MGAGGSGRAPVVNEFEFISKYPKLQISNEIIKKLHLSFQKMDIHNKNALIPTDFQNYFKWYFNPFNGNIFRLFGARDGTVNFDSFCVAAWKYLPFTERALTAFVFDLCYMQKRKKHAPVQRKHSWEDTEPKQQQPTCADKSLLRADIVRTLNGGRRLLAPEGVAELDKFRSTSLDEGNLQKWSKANIAALVRDHPEMFRPITECRGLMQRKVTGERVWRMAAKDQIAAQCDDEHFPAPPTPSTRSPVMKGPASRSSPGENATHGRSISRIATLLNPSAYRRRKSEQLRGLCDLTGLAGGAKCDVLMSKSIRG